MSHIVAIISLINMSTSPSIYSITFFFVTLEIAFILISRLITFFPDSMPVADSAFEIPFVKTSVFPEIFSKSIEFTIDIVSLIQVSINESLCSLSIFHKFIKCTLVTIPLCLSEYSKSTCLTLFPLSKIRISNIIFPHSSPMFHVIKPLPLINLSIRPYIFALSLQFPKLIATLINTAICKFLISFAMTQIINPISLICLATIIDHQS